MLQKLLIITTLLFIGQFTLQATHNRGGRIEYRHISGLTYEARIITHTKISPPSNQADRTELQINWGDGSPEATAPRFSTTLVAPDVQENVYTATHTYTNIGNYTIGVQDPNRNDNIVNINNGNSVGIAFYVNSTLNVTGSQTVNNSAVLLEHPIMTAQVGETYSYTPTAYDPDGDILRYEMVTPLRDLNTTVSGYQAVTDVMPSANNQTTFDPSDGTFIWDAPQMPGEYTVTFLIKEYRNCVVIGTMLVDFQIIVYNRPAGTTWMTANNLTLDSVGNYTVAPNTTIELGASYQDSLTTVQLDVYSETLTFGTATATRTTFSPNHDSMAYTWTPTASDVRCAPYIVTFRGKSDYPERIDQNRSVKIYVRDQSSAVCDTLLGPDCLVSTRVLPNSSSTKVLLHPNPFQEQCTFHIDSKEPLQEVQLSVFDAFGQQVVQESFFGNSYVLENRALATGVYFYALRLKDGQLLTGKMVKL